MRKSVCYLAAAALLGFGGSAFAEIGTIDDVPAATLLLPYFEVSVDDDNGINTLFSINNASAAAAVAHVTIWTDASIPTLDFDVYLTGYDVQTISLRDIFRDGFLPETGDFATDAAEPVDDLLSPSPPLGPVQSALVDAYVGPFTPGTPTEWTFGGTSPGGPCTPGNPYRNPVLTANRLAEMRAAHTGQPTVLFGGAPNRCVGFNHGDAASGIFRGYVTVDSVSQCNLSFPSDIAYQTTFIDERNILWGDYFYVNPGQNFAQGETLVHIEACDTTGTIGQGAVCAVPFSTPGGDYTFYGRYFTVAGQDQREPLATTFATRFINGGAFDGGTDLIVWRDSKTLPTGALGGPWVCPTFQGPGWWPLNQTDVVAFDEQENPEDRCGTSPGGIISPPDPGTTEVCATLEAQRLDLETGNAASDPINPSYNFGWLYLNLNTLVTGVAYPGYDINIAQAWVTTVMDAEGRFSVGYDAIQLDNANASSNILFGNP